MVVMWFSEILTDLDEKENEETGLLKPARNKRQIKGKRNKRPRYLAIKGTGRPRYIAIKGTRDQGTYLAIKGTGRPR